MQTDRNKILIESIRRLIRRDATSHLVKIINKTHAADLAVVFRYLSPSNQIKIFDLIEDLEKKSELFSALDEDTFLELNEGIELDDVVEIFEQMPTDDVADLLGQLPEGRSNAIIEKMKKRVPKRLKVCFIMEMILPAASWFLILLPCEEIQPPGKPSNRFKKNIWMWRCRFTFMCLIQMANWWALVL